jgi:hypothetical protein
MAVAAGQFKTIIVMRTNRTSQVMTFVHLFMEAATPAYFSISFLGGHACGGAVSTVVFMDRKKFRRDFTRRDLLRWSFGESNL